MTVILDDGVMVRADEITVEAVIAEESVTVLAPALVVSEVTHGEVICVALTDAAEDGVTVSAEDGVIVNAEEITVEAVIAEDNVTVLAPAVVDRPTIQLPT